VGGGIIAYEGDQEAVRERWKTETLLCHRNQGGKPVEMRGAHNCVLLLRGPVKFRIKSIIELSNLESTDGFLGIYFLGKNWKLDFSGLKNDWWVSLLVKAILDVAINKHQNFSALIKWKLVNYFHNCRTRSVGSFPS
jgi:hypothetical protein